MARQSEIDDRDLENYLKGRRQPATPYWFLAIDKVFSVGQSQVTYGLKIFDSNSGASYHYDPYLGIKKREDVKKLDKYPYRTIYENVKKEIIDDFLKLKNPKANKGEAKKFVSRWYPEMLI